MKHLPITIKCLLCGALWMFPHLLSTQELKDLFNQVGLHFGSPLQHIHDPSYVDVYRNEINAATIMTYWKYTTHQAESVYTFADSDAQVALAQDIGVEMHGHPLVWGSDVHIPDWVLAKDPSEGEAIMLEHIDTVLGYYAGLFKLWDVVNEAIEDDGTYRNSYWNRAMTGEFVIKAFRRAHQVDPAADLIYNDYGIEINEAKFNTVKDLLGWLQSENVGLTGLGWQLHAHVNDVLAPDFALEDRMDQVSDMGLKNYVTELDIRIDSKSPTELQRQKEAYKKVLSIFLKNPTRGDYFQTWGLSDAYTWWNDFDTTMIHYPLPFDESMQKKPAYDGMVEALQEYLTDAITGTYRLRNVGRNNYLSQTSADPGSNVNLQTLNPDWYSQRWEILEGPAGSDRLKCLWNDQYLNAPDTIAGTSCNVYTLEPNWWSMMWFLEAVGDGSYRIRNRWSNHYLTGLSSNGVTIQPLDLNSADQRWILEALAGANPPVDCPENYTLADPVVAGQNLTIEASESLMATSTLADQSLLHLGAYQCVELQRGFEAGTGSQLTVVMEGCVAEPPADQFPLSNPNANTQTRQLYQYLNTFQDNPNQCLIAGQNLGWSFEMYDATVAPLQTGSTMPIGIIGGQMRYTTTEIDYPALVQRYTSWQAAGGICEISMLPDNPWTGGSAWDRTQTNISNLTTPGAPGYNAWRTQLDFYANVLSDLQDAGVTVLWRPLMEMNGDWFWYGYVSGSNNQQAFINLYRDMHDYFTNTKGLNNLIWVYSANWDFGSIPSVDFYYPGDEYVDITGLDVYENGLVIPQAQYQTMVNLGKPFALTEFGPHHDDMDGSHDYQAYVNAIRSAFPGAIYALAWHDWPDHLVTWINNQNYETALATPCIVTRNELLDSRP